MDLRDKFYARHWPGTTKLLKLLYPTLFKYSDFNDLCKIWEVPSSDGGRGKTVLKETKLDKATALKF
jgi:hypothetical protein